jgi:hypothetical protein
VDTSNPFLRWSVCGRPESCQVTFGWLLNCGSVALCTAYLLQSEGLSLPKEHSEVSTWASPILAAEGIIPKAIVKDRISEILRSRYKTIVPSGFDFRIILGSSYYKSAVRHQLEAQYSYKTQRSRYVCQMDNFNQILLKRLFKKYPKHANIPWKNVWATIDYKDLNVDFPTFTNVAKLCHKVRTSCPEPHPYSQTLSAFGREVTERERNRLISQLRSAYQEFVNKC